MDTEIQNTLMHMKPVNKQRIRFGRKVDESKVVT